ncbi:transcriptional repressor [Salibacteraceae bacterium]|jgi:Fur family ferric uptake transcriptional regulator|nr:transcriptional repressor [Salibacteraceae bacterium]
MKSNLNSIEQLRSLDLKATSIRVDLLSILSESEKAISYSKIQDSLHDFDRITLYRTINTFLEKGIIHKALIEDNETFYALCGHNCTSQGHSHRHIHFKCKKCEQVSCVQTNHSIDIEVPGHSIDRFEIEAVGTCDSCLK